MNGAVAVTRSKVVGVGKKKNGGDDENKNAERKEREQHQEEQCRRTRNLRSVKANLDRRYFVFEASATKVIKAEAPATPVSLLMAGSP